MQDLFDGYIRMYIPVWTAFADLLVSEGSSQDSGDGHIGVGVLLHPLINAVQQAIEKLKGIVLLPKIHLLTP